MISLDGPFEEAVNTKSRVTDSNYSTPFGFKE